MLMRACMGAYYRANRPWGVISSEFPSDTNDLCCRCMIWNDCAMVRAGKVFSHMLDLEVVGV